jgi:hypothetical protein
MILQGRVSYSPLRFVTRWQHEREFMPYTCDAIVVTCIDARFQQSFDQWLPKTLGYGRYDHVSFIGGVKSRGAVSSQIVLSKQLHSIKKIVLVNHEECAVYGLGTAAELSHRVDLLLARQQVLAEFPDLRVELYYAKLNGTFVRVE